MNEFQKNINWDNIQEDNSSIFIPPIKYGKVTKVHSGDSFTIITQIPFFHEIIETASIYHFNIYLDAVSAPKIISIINDDPAKLSKDALKKLIYGNIVELCDISIDKYGKLYANVFIDNIHINDWLLKNNFVIKSKNGKNRRMSDSEYNLNEKISDLDSNFNDKIKSILPNIISTSIIDILLESSSSKKIENNFILPKLSNDENRLNSFSSSSNIQSHCFLSHNWGEKNKNHEIVKKTNIALKKRGLNTWFDENKIDGNIRFKIAEGIDNTKCLVVFITKEYRDKVNGFDMKDNCKYEFTYAMNQLGSQNMISVIMEEEMKETNKWKGELGAALGNMLYIDFTEEIDIEKKYDELYKRIKHIINKGFL